MTEFAETCAIAAGGTGHGAGAGAEAEADAEGGKVKAVSRDRNDDSADVDGDNGTEKNEINASDEDVERSHENNEGNNDDSKEQNDGDSIEIMPSSPGTESGKKRISKGSVDAKGEDMDEEPLPRLPLKKARTAYFIFADEKREELKQLVRSLRRTI